MEAELCLLSGRPRERRRAAAEVAALEAPAEPAEPAAVEPAPSLPSLRGPYLFLRYLDGERGRSDQASRGSRSAFGVVSRKISVSVLYSNWQARPLSMPRGGDR